MNIRFLLWLFRSAGIRQRDLFFSAFLTLLAALLEGLSLSLLIPILDALLKNDPALIGTRLPWISGADHLLLFYALSVLVALALIAKNILNYTATASVNRWVRRSESWLRVRVYERYLSFGKLFFDRNSSGRLYQIMAAYTTMVAEELAGIHRLFYDALVAVIYLTLMVLISWKLTIFVIFASVVMYFSVGKLIEKIKRASDAYSQSTAVLIRELSNTLTCIPLVKSYTSERREKERFARSHAGIEASNISMDNKKLLIGHMQEILMILMILVLAGVVARWVLNKGTGIAEFMIFFVFTRRLALVAGGLSKTWASITSTGGPMRAIEEILDDREKFFVPDGKIRFAGLKDRVRFDHLSFSYEPGIPALRDVSFSVEKGRMTAIVGPSGSGKTTLIHLLMRFYDAPPGSIRIDGTDIRDLTLESLRAGIALVSQEPLLFSDSIRANLTYGLERAVSEIEIREALEKAALWDLIKALPKGLETELGDRGARLSEGEGQRLSIARAILKDAEILIFDEATSALDTANEMLIQTAIDRAARGRTSIVIAHRLSTIKNADRVIVIEHGAIAEEGGVEELLSKDGRFSHYWQMQR